MTVQLSIFDRIASPSASSQSRTIDLRVHESAMRKPHPGFESALVLLYRALAEYADAHAKAYESPISEDWVIGDYWRGMCESALGLLCGELGRLDGGTVDAWLRELMESGGSPEAIRTARERTAPEVAPVAASRAFKPGVISTGMSALSDRQRELLACVRVENNFAVYTRDEFIQDWAELKAIMLALGGSWSRKTKKRAGGFAFPDDLDAAELVRLALETGEVMDPKAAEFFETPGDLAYELAAYIAPAASDRILEPSAGRGALVLALRRAGFNGEIDCCESFEPNVRELRSLGIDPLATDFLSFNPGPIYDGIAMNPPFSKRQDVRHIMHALDCLRLGGRLAAIASSGVRYRDDTLGREFRATLERHGAEIRDNPEGSFKASGTMVRTVSIFLTKGS